MGSCHSVDNVEIDIRDLSQRGDHIKLNDALAPPNDIKRINEKDAEGWSPLHWASSNLHYECCKILIKFGANINAKTNVGYTPLHYSCMHGGAEITTLLLDNGALIDENSNSNKYSPLHWACDNGHQPVVKILVDRGASLTTEDKNKCTPLHWASYSGHSVVALFLVERGANPFVKCLNGTCPAQQTGLKDYKKELKKAILVNRSAARGGDGSIGYISLQDEHGQCIYTTTSCDENDDCIVNNVEVELEIDDNVLLQHDLNILSSPNEDDNSIHTEVVDFNITNLETVVKDEEINADINNIDDTNDRVSNKDDNNALELKNDETDINTNSDSMHTVNSPNLI